MRKQHYAILANILRRHFQSASNNQFYSEETRELIMCKLDSVADCFARECGINRDEFLRACGMLKS